MIAILANFKLEDKEIMNIFATYVSKKVRRIKLMKEMIVIQSLADGTWQIQVQIKKGKNKLIQRRKVCKI